MYRATLVEINPPLALRKKNPELAIRGDTAAES